RYLEDFEEVSHLGSGSFGSVNACLSRLDGCMYAVKEDIRGSSHWTDSALRRLLREVFALAALCNQADIRTFHIVRYHQAWFEDNGTLFIQTELCSATLRDEMTGKLKDEKSDGGTHILLALELVHEKGMVHLDIKPENIFTKNGLYKLGDFGLAHVLTKEGHTNSDVEEGDSRYMPKDLLNGSPSDLTKARICSMMPSSTMYEVCLNKPLPICGKEWHDLREGKLSSLPGTLPCLYTIIREMMHPNPDKRPSATDLLSRKELSCESDNLFLFGRNTMSSYKVCLTKKSSQAALKRSRSWEL
ncbi:hypothetical protein THAPSDRAFT_263366, partial [Thalassiosira pseudonana CCMP1335]